MTYLVLQTILLLALAYFIGAVAGCVLRKMFPGDFVDEYATAGAGAQGSDLHPLFDDKEGEDKATVSISRTGLEQDAAATRPVSSTEILSGGGLGAGAATGAVVAGLAGKEGDQEDDLSLIKGIGSYAERRLKSLGVTRFAHIAEWTGDDIELIDYELDFHGRIEREDWVEQARILATGETPYFLDGKAVTRTVWERVTQAEAARKNMAPDDLTQINGVGAVLAKKLNDMGFTRFEDVANLSAFDIGRINRELNFSGRIERENWVGQAREILARRKS